MKTIKKLLPLFVIIIFIYLVNLLTVEVEANYYGIDSPLALSNKSYEDVKNYSYTGGVFSNTSHRI